MIIRSDVVLNKQPLHIIYSLLHSVDNTEYVINNMR